MSVVSKFAFIEGEKARFLEGKERSHPNTGSFSDCLPGSRPVPSEADYFDGKIGQFGSLQ